MVRVRDSGYYVSWFMVREVIREDDGYGLGFG